MTVLLYVQGDEVDRLPTEGAVINRRMVCRLSVLRSWQSASNIQLRVKTRGDRLMRHTGIEGEPA